MQTLKFIGNGSAFSNRTNNCAYYKDGNYLLLLDCGEDIYKTVKDSNLLDDVTEIDIWISHLHGDHAGGLSTFLFHCFYIKGIKPNVLLPDGFEDLRTYVKITGNEKVCTFKPVKMHGTTRIHEGMVIGVRESKHSFIPSYSLLIVMGSKYIYYTGDTCKLPERIVFDFKHGGIRELYCDTCLIDFENNPHMHIDKLYKTLNGKYNDRVFCMHLDTDEIVDKIKEYGFNVAETTPI